MLSKTALSPWQQVLEAANAAGFWWMTGFEGSNIPQIEADEYEWTQHYENWASDLALVRERLGVRRLRYTLPWQKLNPAPHRFDWAWADQVIERAGELELDLILNPIHFGAPLWLKESFGNPDFPQYAGEYFFEVARRYGQQIKFYTPHNEPLISALFCGDFGHWPPYWQGLKNYARMVNQIARQIVLSVKAVKQAVPDAVIVHVEAGEYYDTRHSDPGLLRDIQLRNERRFLVYDLVNGQVDSEHLLAEWLARHGLTDEELAWFHENSIELDVVGVDFYPHCEVWMEPNSQGEPVQHRDHGYNIVRAFERYGDSTRVKQEADLPISLSGLLRQYYERYRRPVMLTESDYCGQHHHKASYMRYTVQEIQRLRAEGVPVLGYTWWPATDHLNWDKALKERGQIHPVGLWELTPQPNGKLARVETVAVEAFRQLAANSQTSVGDVKGVNLEKLNWTV
jgi:beta-glucosidase/6-phospho-beta-glucosidase/beta-galactosidase